MTATPHAELLPLIRRREAHWLARSPAFSALPPERRREIAHDTEAVLSYILGGADGSCRPASITISGNARAFAGAAGPRPRRRAIAAEGPADRPLADTVAGVVARVDFPQFVAGLIDGVFRAIVDSSVQQMEAYAELVKRVARSASEYASDHVSDDQARDYLLERYPGEVDADAQGRVDPALLRAARRRIAMDRQQLLATMVLMGINRIVVTGGSIEASCRFDPPAADAPSRMPNRGE
jgi:hypothetical protein